MWHCTNTDDSIGAHTDGFQLLQVGLNSIAIVAFNSFSNINGGGFFYEPNAANNNGIVSSDVTNVINLVNQTAYQVCTNTAWSTNPTPSTVFVYNGTNYPIGSIFTATTVTNGWWNDISHMGFLKISNPNGTAYFVGNTVEKVAYQGVDAYDNLKAFWAFNNTFISNRIAGSDSRDYQTYITNQYFFNNLYIGAGRGVPMIVSPDNVDISSHVTEHSGWNMFNTDGLFGDTPSHNTTLTSWKSTFPSLEINSFIGNATFLSAGNYRIAFSDGSSLGTNLTSTLPDLSRIPSNIRPNLSVDADGNQRPTIAAWDIGAFQRSGNPYYRLDVIGGLADGVSTEYLTNTQVAAIVTNAIGFTNWINAAGIVASTNSPITYLTMPNSNYTLVGNFYLHNLTVNGGTGGGDYPTNVPVTITATYPHFLYWDSPYIFNTNTSPATLYMPYSNITVTAVYLETKPFTNIQFIHTYPSATATFSSPNIAGDTIVVAIVGTAVRSSITDSANNNYLLITNIVSTVESTVALSLFAATNINAYVNNVISCAAGNDVGITAVEYSGVGSIGQYGVSINNIDSISISNNLKCMFFAAWGNESHQYQPVPILNPMGTNMTQLNYAASHYDASYESLNGGVGFGANTNYTIVFTNALGGNIFGVVSLLEYAPLPIPIDTNYHGIYSRFIIIP